MLIYQVKNDLLRSAYLFEIAFRASGFQVCFGIKIDLRDVEKKEVVKTRVLVQAQRIITILGVYYTKQYPDIWQILRAN